jgi:hypothetical protein
MKRVKVKVTVTRADIRCGKRMDPYSCPIARAVIRASGCQDISVGSYTARVGQRVFNLSRAARRFVFEFDKRAKGKPFSFYMTQANYGS